ncbi:SlyX family protein [Paracoccus tibetensis]|uniref:SlyX protein n=1 Tax=Paracoccus tibetensis TaxID=336292 RepID=A0A1G5CC13_9RHOB|nr:SlyX family protein [Paracoccus tibetensis]SCX99850.1 SlyX protein [Paracoccus tibetensis]
MDKDATGRLTALEETLAHQARMIDDLSEIVARQGAELDRLARRLGMLMEAEAQRQLDTGGTIPLADQRPPHY